MSQTGTVAKLEALLARIRTRAAAPRADAPALAAAPAHVAAVAPPIAVPIAQVAPAAHAQPAVPAAPPATARVEAPEPVTLPPPAAGDSGDADLAVDIDVTEVGQSLPPQEPDNQASVNGAESVERWVAAPSIAPASVDVAHPAAPSVAPTEDVDALLEASVSEPPATSAADEPPASSRRPVASEPEPHLADMAFGADGEVPLPPPRHTPPPKSGRLPAPPVAEFDTDFVAQSAQAPAATVLVAQPVRPNLPSATGTVVDVIAVAARFAPTSFAELLDASLEL